MKKMMMMIAILASSLSFAQVPQEDNVSLSALSNGDIKVEGVDAFGALVAVTYNGNYEKIYQERILNDEMTYARFDQGRVVEYGTIVKPTMANSDHVGTGFKVNE